MIWPWNKKTKPLVARLPESPEERFDFYSGTWQALARYCEHRLTELREHNDTLGLDKAKTEAIRGKIDFCKEILELPKRTRHAG